MAAPIIRVEVGYLRHGHEDGFDTTTPSDYLGRMWQLYGGLTQEQLFDLFVRLLDEVAPIIGPDATARVLGLDPSRVTDKD